MSFIPVDKSQLSPFLRERGKMNHTGVNHTLENQTIAWAFIHRIKKSLLAKAFIDGCQLQILQFCRHQILMGTLCGTIMTPFPRSVCTSLSSWWCPILEATCTFLHLCWGLCSGLWYVLLPLPLFQTCCQFWCFPAPRNDGDNWCGCVLHLLFYFLFFFIFYFIFIFFASSEAV